MRKTLVTLGFSFIFLLLSHTWAFGQDIELAERITVDPAANIEKLPMSFSVTEDKLFLIPDYKNGTVKIFGKSKNFLKFIDAFGRNGFGGEAFSQPMYCFYSWDERKLGVIDYGARRIFIFEKQRYGIDFRLIKSISCEQLGYDIEFAFAGDDQQIIVSGYVTDEESNHFDLYGINIRTGQINYLLPSHQKYNLKNTENFLIEFHKKQSLPAIGIRAFFSIQGDEVFFVWEGALRIIKLDLVSKEITDVFEPELEKVPNYIKPKASGLVNSYIAKDFEKTWKEREKMAYVRNIFTTPRHIFLVYETSKNNKSNASTYRLQTYTPEGKLLGDSPIHPKPGKQMWFDRESRELYAFSEKPGSDNGEFLIFRYKIKINK